jgi:hypothetical protein
VRVRHPFAGAKNFLEKIVGSTYHPPREEDELPQKI